ncbi:hypothetical protein [Risungbinella massiliensis]|uniref:hypothetical protein n=1 Tax=Risungbinella massiliensis TaxID=1329796 RepID=UPI0005CC5DF2|nr:hypothetical protein [Risungbinella massiliensis]
MRFLPINPKAKIDVLVECDYFDSRREAQHYYDRHKKWNLAKVSRLDRVRDGRAFEHWDYD